MVAANRNPVRCTVVAVGVSADRWSRRGALAQDLVPWADPYVMMLIRRLQDEVRRERQERSLLRGGCGEPSTAAWEFDPCADEEPSWASEMVDDLEIPWLETETEYETVTEDWMPEFGNESEETTLEE